MNPSVVAAFKTQAAAFTGCPLFWPNDTVVPPSPAAPYVWVERIGMNSEVLSMGTPGNNALRDDGYLRFHVLAPYGSGEDAINSIAESLASLYRATSPANLVGLQTLAPTPPELGAQSQDGQWFGVSFTVPYFYLYTG
jgi:hypothetical protein